MGTMMDGHLLASTIRARVREGISSSGMTPGLAVVLVGDDPASHLYVRLKEKACADVGIRFERHQFSDTVPADEVRARIRTLGTRPDINGILVQLPLPVGFDADAIIAEIPPAKDVDGFHPHNLAALERGRATVTPGLARSVLALILTTGQPIAGARLAILANSETFCRPIEYLLRTHGAKVERYAPFQPGTHPASTIARADIIVSALGCGGCLDAAYVRPSTILIDVGIARLANGRTSGDFSRDAQAKSGWYTPVPGGVGPMTVATLLANVAEAARRH